jgi:hypothetical protein
LKFTVDNGNGYKFDAALLRRRFVGGPNLAARYKLFHSCGSRATSFTLEWFFDSRKVSGFGVKLSPHIARRLSVNPSGWDHGHKTFARVKF